MPEINIGDICDVLDIEPDNKLYNKEKQLKRKKVEVIGEAN